MRATHPADNLEPGIWRPRKFGWRRRTRSDGCGSALACASHRCKKTESGRQCHLTIGHDEETAGSDNPGMYRDAKLDVGLSYSQELLHFFYP